MSPVRPKTSGKLLSSESPSSLITKSKYRKRVRKACDRCRIKKTKCDGSSPCLRCKTDNVLCCAKQSHKFRRRNFPQGYAEMLERQQGQLVNCIQQLYNRLHTSGLWGQSLPENSDGQPFTHDVLAALDLLEQRDDGSGEFETFEDVVRPSQSDDSSTTPVFKFDGDATPPVFELDGDTAVHHRHDSITNQGTSASPSNWDTTARSPGSTNLESHSNTSIRTSSPLTPNSYPSPEHPKQTQNKASTTPPTPTQTRAEYTSSQAQLFATLAATPIHRSVYDKPNTPFQHSAMRPSLSLDPLLTRRDYLPNQPMTVPSTQFPFSHEWARSGITLDGSDFSTDFHQLSPLDAGSTGFGSSSLVPGTI